MMQTSLRWHLRIFLLVNGLLAAINLVFSPSVLWFLWVTGSWGIGVLLHAFAVSDAAAAEPARASRRGRASPAEELGTARTRLSERAPEPAPSPAVALHDSLQDVATHVRSLSNVVTSQRAERAAGLQAGQQIAGRFVVERALGAGGMGEVYLARDTLLGERVALKTIAASEVSAPALERFKREALAARRITHPHVVRIHDIGQDGARSFISMEYIEGQTLRQRVERDGPLPLGEIQRVALQVCHGLEAAHGAAVVHRDLKPDNILLDRDGQARVIDFGLARLESSSGLTSTGTVMGTPDYMAPEQVLGKPADVRTDVYAMGCVLYFMVAGAAPFVRDSAIAVGMAHCHDRPPPLTDHRPDLPGGWEALVQRALEKEADQRFQTIAELRHVLQSL